jgi:hypothetical protein
MATKSVEQIYKQQIKVLPAADQLRLVELIAHGMADTIGRDLPPPRSLLELEGLGAEIWQGVDAQAYMNELRKEWDQRS